jgi:hypothetical protein
LPERGLRNSLRRETNAVFGRFHMKLERGPRNPPRKETIAFINKLLTWPK